MTNYRFEKETGRILHQETEDGNVVILYNKQDQVIDTIDVIEKTSILQLTDDLFEIVQSVGSPARFVFYYDAQTCKISDVFFNPILIENQYIAYIENGELIIRDIFDEVTFCKKIARDFTETADPTSAIISITLQKEGQFVIEYYEGEDLFFSAPNHFSTFFFTIASLIFPIFKYSVLKSFPSIGNLE